MPLSVTNTFVAHTTAKSTDVNQNFQDVQTAFNNSVAGQPYIPWTDWVPTYVNLASTPTLTFAKYFQVGTVVYIALRHTAQANTSAAGPVQFTLPVTPRAANFVQDIPSVIVNYGASTFMSNLFINGGKCYSYVMTFPGSSVVATFGNFGSGSAWGFLNTVMFWYIAA